ncbi:hypothetical protein [Streptomyces carpaticus]|uniref:Lipoprotein n=1 Tax=Streptomyces carpaticus TaxID=285558 RepID=A0ABV4ZKM2_9ACTN
MRRSVAVLLGCLAGLGSAGCVSVHPAGGDVCAGPAAERPASCGPDDAGGGAEGAEAVEAGAAEPAAGEHAPAGEPQPHPVPEPTPSPGGGTDPGAADGQGSEGPAESGPRLPAGAVPELPDGVDGVGRVPSSFAQACELGSEMLDPAVLDLCRSAGS